MNKNTLILIVVGAVIVVGGASYRIYRWQQQRALTNSIQALYGLSNGLSGSIPNQVAQEMAKQAAKEEAKQKTDEAREAAKTPEDRYNETTEMPAYDENVRTVSAAAKEIVEKAFGKSKLTSFSTGFFGGTTKGSGIAAFKIARLATAMDVGTISTALVDKGLQIITSGTDNKEAMIIAGTDAVQYSISFSIGEQDVMVTIMKQGAE